MAEWENSFPSFWAGMLDYLEIRQYDVTKQRAKSLSRRWMDFTFGIGGMNFYLSLNQDYIRVGLNLDRTKTRNAFDTYLEIKKQKSQIEHAFGSNFGPPIWEQRTEKRCSIRCERHVDFESSSTMDWPEYYEWMERHLGRFQMVFLPRLENLRGQLNPNRNPT